MDLLGLEHQIAEGQPQEVLDLVNGPDRALRAGG
jgi:hypothetical protein